MRPNVPVKDAPPKKKKRKVMMAKKRPKVVAAKGKARKTRKRAKY